LGADEGFAFLSGLSSYPGSTLSNFQNVEVIICPTYLLVQPMAYRAIGSPIHIGAQNCFWEEKGAFTGEVSAALLKSAGASHVIIGHSERRQLFQETDVTVNKRLQAALKAGLIPIVCVGETLAERDAGQLQQVLTAQVTGALAGFTAAQLETLIIAYEPVWAIGTGRTATSAQAQEAHAFIRSVLRKQVGALAERARILYGGSVKPDNTKELLSMGDVDGALVGGASLKLADFSAIVAAATPSASALTNSERT
jgi:triosephosphate isomerase